jgi:hypothetical protein
MISTWQRPADGLVRTHSDASMVTKWGCIMAMLAELDATARPDIVPNIAADRLAEFDVAAIDELAAMSAEQRIARLRSMADRVFNAAAIGSYLMARDMTAVIDLLLENPRGFGDARLELAKASEEARCFLTIIEVAERRLAAGLVAIANSSAPRIDLDAFARALNYP